jgi:glycosyltransferase involved in cell wall biosynthesis
MKVCLASIHPRMLSGQIEGLVAIHDRLGALGHSVELVSAFRTEQLRADQRWARDVGDGLSLAPKVVRIGRIVAEIANRGRDCDVLHFNVPTPAFSGLADLVQLLTRRPMVIGFEAHLADVPAVARRLVQAPEFYAPRVVVNNGLVARMTLHRGRRYVVSSEMQRRELLKLGYDAPRIDVIPNLFDEGKLRRWDRAEARKALNLPVSETDPLVVFVGHYHDVKGHDVLIDAFAAVRARVPGARLVLAWSGIGNRAKVQAAIARAGIGDAVIELKIAWWPPAMSVRVRK